MVSVNLSNELLRNRLFPGERTPVGIRLTESPANVPRHWMLCKAARQFGAAVLGSESAIGGEEPRVNGRRVVERLDGTKSDGEWYVFSSFFDDQ